MVYLRAARVSWELQSIAAEVVSRCRSFDTLENHAERIRQELALPPSASDELRQLLHDLSRTELLPSARELLRRCVRAADPGRSRCVIGAVGIPTRDRTSSLRRALESYMENARRHGRTAAFFVTDNSPTAGARTDNRQMLAELRGRHAVAIAHAGLEEKHRFAEALASEAEVPRALIDFALFSSKEVQSTDLHGANRNAMLLHAAGEPFLSVDDDTVCEAMSAPAPHEGLALHVGEDAPMRLRFFPDREASLRAASRVDRDVLALHEQLLGRDVGSLLEEEAGRTSLGDIDAGFLQTLAHRGGRVVVVSSGSLGDSGMSSLSPISLLHFRDGDSIIRSDDMYRIVIRGEVLRDVDRMTINEASWFMSMAFSADNRELLPPFFPFGRGSDDGFGVLLKISSPDSYLGFLPWSVIHAPMSPRARRLDEFLKSPIAFGMDKIVDACVRSFSPAVRGPDAAAVLERLGRHLIDLGSADVREFEEFVRLARLAQRTTLIAQLEEAIPLHNSTAWAREASACLDALRAATARDGPVIPLHAIIPDASASDILLSVQRSVRSFGELLAAWPQIREGARRLRLRGIRLATPV